MNLGFLVVQFRAFLRRFRNKESGQDLAEYCLLTALLTLLVAGIFVYASGGVQAIWAEANTSLAAGNTATTTGAATATSTSGN